jgi:hypothetical protein
VAKASAIQATFIVADYVQEVGGKLYINGGGWTKILRANQPASMGIAVKLRGRRAPNKERKFLAELVDSRGRVVGLKNAGDKKSTPVRVSGILRPAPGTPKTAPIEAAIAANVVVALKPGRYEWRLEIDRRRLATWPFEVVMPELTTAPRKGKKTS